MLSSYHQEPAKNCQSLPLRVFLGDCIKVTELAPRLAVSEGTIRNDLRFLEKAGRLTRVRGGAVPRDEQRHYMNASFAARVQKRQDAKNWIARRAAEMVEDGDSILLDASTTVFAMVPYLQERRNLRIVTNGFEVGLALAKNSSNSVILIGGTISSRGTSVVGHLGESLLRPDCRPRADRGAHRGSTAQKKDDRQRGPLVRSGGFQQNWQGGPHFLCLY